MSLVTNRRVLRTEIPPEEMYLREGQMDHLRSVLEPIQYGQRVDGAFIYGPPGGGKTHAAQLLVSRLKHAAGHIQTTHIDCWQYHTTTAIATQLLDGLGGAAAPDNVAGYELMDRLRNELESPYVVILDEADQIEDDRILYELHKRPRVTLLLIANDYAEFYEPLDMRVESRLNYQPIEFQKYKHDQLAGILERRIEQGVRPNVVPDEVVDTIVDVSSNDARKAIDNLRKAIDRAAAEGRDRVSHGLVHAVAPETERDLVRKTFSKLTRKQRVLYEILVEDGGELAAGDIYEQVCDRIDEPPSTKTVTRNLKKMAHYDIVDYTGENSARRYWATTEELYPRNPA
ncbi:AAA ATPase (plasmid) [Haloterrigena turkmenica DSM 5511]|uniref:AAA ATPase n=1 Tax=Haloterrigena turkmenica (strain ATCC 51198 / DSM 5511 / JCM 9101 / NCIMB 13204 / VKM B-1734 / 4k) TaxID=543526 RepID=D2S3P4_HALTV|nr:Cdc6/Cdc18 family protein [Haloterrigena turkmenica]ADB63991.1 AAA ATPase [Haloterrigena turkmenica DSM 5511]